MKIWHVDEDGGCVDHWIIAEDEPQARGLLIGNILQAMCVEEASDKEFEFKEIHRSELEGMEWSDDGFGSGGLRPALDMLDEQAAAGPGYVACSEF